MSNPLSGVVGETMGPCPFCGGSPSEISPSPTLHTGAFSVECVDCGTMVRVDAGTRHDAIAAWNRRSSSPETPTADADSEPWFGCFTGDCPHGIQAECDAAIRAEFARMEREEIARLTKEREEAAALPSSRALSEEERCANCGKDYGNHFDGPFCFKNHGSESEEAGRPSYRSPQVSETRIFDLGDVLTITDGRLVSPRMMDGVYDILNFMTGDSIFTHQIPRAMQTCRPALLAQHPQLADVDRATELNAENIWTWLAAQKRIFGESLPVTPLARQSWVEVDPILEAQALFGKDRVIPVSPHD